MIPLLSSSFGNGVPSLALWRIVSSNRITPADVVLRALGCEEQLAVGAPVVLGRLGPDRVEALLDRAVALVRRQDSLALGDKRSGSVLE
jgi:hypothetical protein